MSLRNVCLAYRVNDQIHLYKWSSMANKWTLTKYYMCDSSLVSRFNSIWYQNVLHPQFSILLHTATFLSVNSIQSDIWTAFLFYLLQENTLNVANFKQNLSLNCQILYLSTYILVSRQTEGLESMAAFIGSFWSPQ